MTRVYGSPDFDIKATSNSGANLSYVVKSVPFQNVITSTSSGKVTIQNAGVAEVIISAPQVTKGVITYLPATKTIKVTIQKATRTISFDKEIYTTKFGPIIAKVTQSGPATTPTYEVVGSAGVVGPILPVDPNNPFEVNVYTIGAVGRATVIKVTAFPGMNFLPASDTAIVKIEQRDLQLLTVMVTVLMMLMTISHILLKHNL